MKTFGLVVLLASAARAAGPGTSAATFLNLGFGARPLAMGEAFVAVADDVSTLHYNPAGLAFRPEVLPGGRAKSYELLMSHSLHIQDIRLSQLGFITRPFGFSATYLNMGGIERRTAETARPEGSFGASDLALGVSYGRKLGTYGLGGTVKLVRQTIGEYSASAYAMDLGALKRIEKYPVTFGASLTNLGTKVKFIERGYPLPMAFRVGAAYGMTPKFPHAISLQLDFPRDDSPSVRLGFEYAGFGPFALRAGYRTVSAEQKSAALGKALGSTAPGLSEFYGFFMGVGFRTKLGSMDYSILPYGELGNAHRFSMSLRFGGKDGRGLIRANSASEGGRAAAAQVK